MSLPIVVFEPDPARARDVVESLVTGYRAFYGCEPPAELVSSWRSSIPRLFSVVKSAGGYPVVLELPLFGFERVDFVVVGRGKALVVEAKGWRSIRRLNYVVLVDGLKELDPCYQLENYVSKLRYLSTASDRMVFDGVVYLYSGAEYRDSCRVVRGDDELREAVESLGSPGTEEDVYTVANTKLVLRRDLIDFIRSNMDDLLREAAKTLVSSGYGLDRDQIDRKSVV